MNVFYFQLNNDEFEAYSYGGRIICVLAKDRKDCDSLLDNYWLLEKSKRFDFDKEISAELSDVIASLEESKWFSYLYDEVGAVSSCYDFLLIKHNP